ncbi:MAG: hypothetical protein ACTHK3_07980 [Solirubrobacterales bacterium]
MPADGAITSSRAARAPWRETLADPLVRAAVVYSLVALAAAVAAYFTIFGEFATYDDEGTLLVTLKAFVHGHALYRDVYSEYGPFYYEVFGGLFALTGKAVTTDASRTIVVLVWVASSLLSGIAAHRLTRSLALGVVGTGAAFSALFVLANEPMHPQGLCVLLFAAVVAVLVFGPGRRVGWMGCACGALLGALLMTKVNLGAFAIAGLALAAVLTIPSLNRRRWLVWLVAAAYLVLPFAVMARNLSEGWVRELILIMTLSMAALVVSAWWQRPARDEEDATTVRWLLGAVAGLVVAAVAILIAILLTGPSLSDVYDGMIVQAIRVRDVLITPLALPGAGVDWAVGTLAAAVLVARLRPSAGREPALWPGLLRAGIGLTILLALAHIVPIALNPSSQSQILLPVLLSWVAAVPPLGAVEGTYKRFLRVALPAMAIAEALQVFPVAGSQVGIAAFAFVPVGALCLADALVSLRAWGAARDVRIAGRLGIVAAVVTVALAAQFTLDAILRPAVNNAVAYYREKEPLPFKGATALRLPPEEVNVYSGIVSLIHRYRCTNFIGYPNIDSFYVWSGVEPPAPAAPGAWIKALDAEEQRRIVREMKATPRPCAIRNYARAEAWIHSSTPPPGLPLVNYIFNDFKVVTEVGDFQFLLPKNRS